MTNNMETKTAKKADKYMIGDWVRSSKPFINGVKELYQISKIDGAGYFVVENSRRGSRQFMDELDIEPIPLTVEIFEKNGWYQGKCGGETLYYIPHKVFYLAKAYEKGYMTIGTLVENKMLNLFSIQYVHELQNFLRLFGMDDIEKQLKI